MKLHPVLCERPRRVERKPRADALALREGVGTEIFTHSAREEDVRAAVAWVDALRSTAAPTRVIRIESVG